MDPKVIIVLFIIGLSAIVIFGGLALVARFYRKVNQGQALIINKMKVEPEVTFTGGIVVPIIHRAETMDISVKTIEIERRGEEGLICADNIRADIKVTFFVRVNKTKEDVLKVAQAIGCVRASEQRTLEELFVAKFSEALKTVGKRMEFVQLYTQRDQFKDQIVEVIGRDLNGYALEDAAIDFLEQTPLTALNKDNILDAVGIRKITMITCEQNIETNDLRQSERKAIAKQNVEGDEAIMELERRRADAESKQKREIATMRARETAETEKVQAEEKRRADLARIKAEEEVSVGDLTRQRSVEMAEKDKERVIKVKIEQVEKDRALEAISREREVELQRIDKEKALEIQRKEIADVVRGRIAVEKSVAQEEENIKDLRATADANRKRSVVIINAEATAQEQLVKDLKAAEALEKVAEHKGRERLTLANADLDAADKTARAKVRTAEGVQAETAAKGLAEVRVAEAQATAIEKQGMANVAVRDANANVAEKEGKIQASILRERLMAEAQGEEQKGLAQARVAEAQAAAREKLGQADASAIRAKLLAEAAGKEADAQAMKSQFLAHAAGKEADAVAQEKMGLAEAVTIRERMLAQAAGNEADAVALERKGMAEAVTVRERMLAEAMGIAKKAEAMKTLDGSAREHEEFRLKLEKIKEVELASLVTRQQVARSQAEVLGKAFNEADIKIIGGDGQFFDRFVRAASMGNVVDGFVGESETVRHVFDRYLQGDKDLAADIQGIVGSLAGGAQPLRDLTATALLTRLLSASEGPLRTQIQGLLEHMAKQDSPKT